MPDFRIDRQHKLGLIKARQVAQQWLSQLQGDFGLSSDYQEMGKSDIATFRGPLGVTGEVEVSGKTLSLICHTGSLPSSMSKMVEEKVSRKIDTLLGSALRNPS